LSAPECDAIRRFVQAGGALFATGDTGTRDSSNKHLDNFALADVLGVRYLGRAEARRGYLRAAIDGIPRMDIQINGAYARIQTTTAQSLVDLVPPTAQKQAPAELPSGPGVTLNRFGNGRAIYCAAPLFGAYHLDGTPVLRKLASWMFGQVHPPAARAIMLEDAPLNVELVCNTRGQDRFIHLLNFTGDRRFGGPQRLSDFSTVKGIHVRLRSQVRPKRVSVVPEKEPIAFEWKDGWAKFQAQPLTIHSVYWIEL
jgi:hypothetical protein